MKATNLSISIPNYGCKKNCPYCISKMTGYVKKDLRLFHRNLNKVKSIAKQAEVSSISFTSKGEVLGSTESMKVFSEIASTFTDEFACEIQTNGDHLTEDIVNFLYHAGIDTIAISIDKFDDIDRLKPIFDSINSYGLTIRLTVNLLPSTYNHYPVDYFQKCKDYNIQQISFRTITTPNFSEVVDTKVGKKAYNWIKENVSQERTRLFIESYASYIKEHGREIRRLPYGAVLYNVEGVSTTHFEYCIQDENGTDDIRSLIYYEDGHLATTWYGSNVGRIL